MNEETTETQRQDRLQEILLNYVEASEEGTPRTQDEFIAAHPEFAVEIVEFLAGYQQLNRLASPLRDEGDTRQARLDVLQAALRQNPARNLSRSTGSLHGSGEVVAPADIGQLGDYNILREIGRGGMGIVYEAEQISLRRRVALKILPFIGGADSRQLQRFRNEAEAAAHLHHSHIVPVFAVGCERGVHYYAMQFIEGQSLAALIDALTEVPEKAGNAQDASPQKERTIESSTLVARTISTEHSTRTYRFYRTISTIGRQTAEALEYAHQTGIVHRDIKPANLLLDSRGEVWITDFGLAQFQNQGSLTMTGELLGTLRYASPEQAMAKRGMVDHRTDIYSLGATLYELLTLKPVFEGKDRNTLLHQIGFEDPTPPRMLDPTIPVELETIVLKALAKYPPERYASAQELADDLQRFLDDKPILAKRPRLIDRMRKWRRRHPSFVAAAMILLMFGLVGFAASTFLIAQEQWRTRAAYEKLAVEEKQTKQAYEQLAVEEKRTKTAYEALAAEQTRTSTAYAAEAKQRDLAERDFAQARRAVDLIVQFSEGELAHNPFQQDVRRRLLFTALDYYEDFLRAHADDPAIQADLADSRERVALILTELASLRATTLIALIQDAHVQQDLALGADQKEQISQFVSKQSNQVKEFTPKFHPKGKSRKTTESAAVIEKSLREILNPVQDKRFQQIVLQVQQQSRQGFTDPKLVEMLKLTNRQRLQIRTIQNETHQAWANHLFTDKKIEKPADFWTHVQDRILTVFEPGQREQWRQLTGPPITIELREGYPWDGKNVNVPNPGAFLTFSNIAAGSIAVMQGREDFTGSGFGHKVRVDDKQYYCWRGKEIRPTVFEIAVTADRLTQEEFRHLIVKDDQSKLPRAPGSPRGWTVLFRSADPSVWNTDSSDEARFAVPLARAHNLIRYLRLKRMDTGEMMIIPVTTASLGEAPRWLRGQEFVWNGSCHDAFGGRHLGIAETRRQDGPSPKDAPLE